MTDHRLYSTPMTGIAAGGHSAVEHEVLDSVRAARSVDGFYGTLCGVRVSPTPCVAPIGRPCLACWELLRVACERETEAHRFIVNVPKQDRGPARHGRRGRFAELLSRGSRDAR